MFKKKKDEDRLPKNKSKTAFKLEPNALLTREPGSPSSKRLPSCSASFVFWPPFSNWIFSAALCHRADVCASPKSSHWTGVTCALHKENDKRACSEDSQGQIS